MKKITSLLLAMGFVLLFGLFALGSTESDSSTVDQGSGKVSTDQSSGKETTDQGSGKAAESEANDVLGDYSVVIDSCRLAQDFQGKDIVIVKYKFTNNDDDPTSFMTAFEDNVYQNGVGLNGCYVADKSANYSNDNQTKEIKKGASLDVEVAYELNDNATDVEVEVKELFSFSDKTLTKTFKIAE